MPRAIRYGLVLTVTAVLWLAAPAGAGLAAVVTSAATIPVAGIEPSQGQVVGVAMPVTVRFAKPITNRAAAEKLIQVSTPTNTTGRFNWLNDNAVQWLPNGFWPAHSEIEVKANGYTTRFETGSTVLGVASISQHTFTVSIDDQVARVMPASMGKPSRPTPVGNFTALEKQRTVTFDSRTIGIPLSSPEGYLITGRWAVRVTWGGVYVHSAPWSVASQGNSNVSHGCINLSPENAEWYFNTVSVGDPIIVQS
ncbi:MAG TPA: L,D-transpeptidase [Mycobacterium sp.]|nr:L,D-transpeptidase [Mycobacterium sp.]